MTAHSPEANPDALPESYPASPAPAGASLALRTYTTRAMVAGTGAVIGVLIARGLGPSGRGQVAFVVSVYYVAVLVLNLGFENALLHQQAEKGASPASLRRLGGFIALGAGVTGIAGAGLIATLLGGSLFADVRVLWLVIAVGALPAALDLLYLRAIFQANHRLVLVNRINFAGAGAQLIIVGLAFGTGRMSVTVALAASTMGVLLPWVVLRWRARTFGRANVSVSMARESLGFGLKSALGLTFLYLLYRIDFVVVKGVIGSSELGRYSAATSVAELLWLATDSIALSLIARQVAGSADEALWLTVRTIRTALLLLPAVAVAVGAGGVYLIPLAFGEGFRGSVAPLVALLPGVVAMGAVKPLTTLMVRHNCPLFLTLASLAGLVVDLVLVVPMARLFGITGVAAASSIAYIAVAGLYLSWLSGRGVALNTLVPGADDLRSLARLPAPWRLVGAQHSGARARGTAPAAGRGEP